MKKFLFILVFLISPVNLLYAGDTVVHVPTNPQKNTVIPEPLGVKAGNAAAAIAENLQWLGGILNTKEQMEKMDKARQGIEKSIPAGEKHNYEVVTKGDKFVGFYKKGEAKLMPGGDGAVKSYPAVISGKGPSKETMAQKQKQRIVKAQAEKARKKREAKAQAEKAKEKREAKAQAEKAKKKREAKARANKARKRREARERRMELERIRRRPIHRRTPREIDRDMYEFERADERDRTG